MSEYNAAVGWSVFDTLLPRAESRRIAEERGLVDRNVRLVRQWQITLKAANYTYVIMNSYIFFLNIEEQYYSVTDIITLDIFGLKSHFIKFTSYVLPVYCITIGLI